MIPRRVVVARNLKKNGSALMKFHRKERLHVVGIAAGMVHSMALTDDGALFYWVSSDPTLKCQQVDTTEIHLYFSLALLLLQQLLRLSEYLTVGKVWGGLDIRILTFS